jgi:hypothetical protein
VKILVPGPYPKPNTSEPRGLSLSVSISSKLSGLIFLHGPDGLVVFSAHLSAEPSPSAHRGHSSNPVALAISSFFALLPT